MNYYNPILLKCILIPRLLYTTYNLHTHYIHATYTLHTRHIHTTYTDVIHTNRFT